MRHRIYLDHNATCPLLDEAHEAMASALEQARRGWGNPSSPHAFGNQARLALEDSRRAVADLIGAEAREILFVSGGTEADNLAIQGSARAWRAAGRGPGHIIASAVEHPAVLESCRYLSAQEGWRLTLLPVDSQGLVDPGDARASLSPDTALITIMAANNETGVMQPVEEIAALAREAGVTMHVDAVQMAGRVPLDARRLGADLVSLSSHKMGGPVGAGALYVREGARLSPLSHGGGQERRLRPGTESVVLAAGFAAAARAASKGWDRVAKLRDRMETELLERIEAIRVNGAAARRLPNTSSITFPGLDNEALVIVMDLAGFALSTGSACSTGSARPSHVLAAMGMTPSGAASTLRVSLGPRTTTQEIDALVKALPAAVADLTPVSAGRRS